MTWVDEAIRAFTISDLMLSPVCMRTFLILYASLLTAALAQLPPDAAVLKAKRDAKVAEIDRIYAIELEICQKRAMADGNLTKANEIEKEIARVIQDPLAPKSASTTGDEAASPEMSRLVGLWRRESDSVTWEFKDAKNGTAGGDKFTVSYSPTDKKYIVVSAKWVNKLSFGLGEDILNGEGQENYKFKLKRIK
jgi:hypothetical protein